MKIDEPFVRKLAVKASTDAAGNCGAPHQLIYPMVYLALKEALIDNEDLLKEAMPEKGEQLPTINSLPDIAKTLPPEATFTSALCLNNSIGKIVEVMQDGTVNIHQLGKEEEAARVFYEALAQYGFDLLGTLKEAIGLIKRIPPTQEIDASLQADIESFTRNIRGKPYNV